MAEGLNSRGPKSLPGHTSDGERKDAKIEEDISNQNGQTLIFFLHLASVFVYCFAIGLYGAIVPNLVLHKVCSPDLQPSVDYVCNDTYAFQKATDVTTTRNTLREVLPVVVLLVAGTWRDATGRNKPLMYLAIFGEIVGVSIELFAAWQWSASVWLTSVVDSALYGLSGGSKLFYVAATCAISDHSSVELRTTRMAFYQAAAYTGSCLSNGVSGYFLHLFGYLWFFSFVIGLHLFTLVLIFLMDEAERKEKSGTKVAIFQNMKAVCISRPNNIVIWLMLLSCVLINVSSGAETNLYLYFLQRGFQFTVVEAGVYSGFRQMFGVLSTTAMSPLFAKVLKWSDFRIGIISSFVTLISSVSMVFAKTVLHLILFALLDFMKIFVLTLPMSIVSKCVRSDELGVFVSLRFIGGCLFPIVVFYFYDCIFSITSKTMPGAFFLASAAISLLVFTCFCVSPCFYKGDENEPSGNNITEFIDDKKHESGVSSKPDGSINNLSPKLPNA